MSRRACNTVQDARETNGWEVSRRGVTTQLFWSKIAKSLFWFVLIWHFATVPLGGLTLGPTSPFWMKWHCSGTVTPVIISGHKLRYVCVWPTPNSLMKEGNDMDTGDDYMGTRSLACPHPLLTARPRAPEATGVFWSVPVLLSAQRLFAWVTQARDMAEWI